jgi:hypothetical protein
MGTTEDILSRVVAVINSEEYECYAFCRTRNRQTDIENKALIRTLGKPTDREIALAKEDFEYRLRPQVARSNRLGHPSTSSLKAKRVIVLAPVLWVEHYHDFISRNPNRKRWLTEVINSSGYDVT